MPARLLSVFILALLAVFTSCRQEPALLSLQAGMVINRSVTIQPGIYEFAAADSLGQPIVLIEGDGITVDFNGAELRGAPSGIDPDQFKGLAVLVRNSRKVTLRNLTARSYKVALMAEGVDSLLVEDCNFSYNYRQRLQSTREREHLADWLSYHNNEADEWLRYGAAVYLKDCQRAVVRHLQVTGGQNGLLLTGCNNGLFYNNTLQFNSGVGIGLYRSDGNRVMHNRLDWNVRGYSHGFYSRGQDSAGILCYEQSNKNIFAFNSATHSGDGFFLWAGASTMDTGKGGCNDNIIFGNDFSHAPTNGIEVTFSRNILANNRLEECTYGIWGGYSFESLITGNTIRDCRHGAALEHGQDNTISYNYFENDEIGIQLWERPSQPPDWVFAQAKDVSSRNYNIQHNVFHEVAIPLQISGTSQVAVNDDNHFAAFTRLLDAKEPNEAFFLVKNDIHQASGWGAAEKFRTMNRMAPPPTSEGLAAWRTIPQLAPIQDFAPSRLPDGIDALLPESHPRGRKFILIDEWGPYDFRRPSIWLREVEDGQYTFLLLGPEGNWRLDGGSGFSAVSPVRGTFPATIVAQRDSEALKLALDLEFIGEGTTTQFGEPVKRGQPIPFSFLRVEKEPVR